MKLKELESCLQDVEGFENPKIKLEQYETPAHIAAHMLYTAESSFGDIKDKFIADLGCGCGMLSIGASLLGASYVLGFEIDRDALDVFQGNLFDSDLQGIEIIEADVLSLGDQWRGKFDTVLLNPPFGTKRNQGIDISFLKTALDMTSRCVLSLHKTSTRNYILKKAKDWNVDCEVIAVLRRGKFGNPPSLLKTIISRSSSCTVGESIQLSIAFALRQPKADNKARSRQPVSAVARQTPNRHVRVCGMCCEALPIVQFSIFERNNPRNLYHSTKMAD